MPIFPLSGNIWITSRPDFCPMGYKYIGDGSPSHCTPHDIQTPHTGDLLTSMSQSAGQLAAQKASANDCNGADGGRKLLQLTKVRHLKSNKEMKNEIPSAKKHTSKARFSFFWNSEQTFLNSVVLFFTSSLARSMAGRLRGVPP